MEHHGIFVFQRADQLRNAVVVGVDWHVLAACDVAADVVGVADVDDGQAGRFGTDQGGERLAGDEGEGGDCVEGHFAWNRFVWS